MEIREEDYEGDATEGSKTSKVKKEWSRERFVAAMRREAGVEDEGGKEREAEDDWKEA